jgi:hypothetical protein
MQTLLLLNIPPALEDDLVDYLLGLDCVGGFTSYKAMGHGEDTVLSIAEQVSGRRQRLQFEVVVDAEVVDRVTAGLAQQVGKDITYWQQSISGLGRT